MRALIVVAAVTLLAGACGEPKAEPQSEAKAEVKADPTSTPAPGQAPPRDTMKAAPDSTAAKQAAGPLRDSAFGPKFKIDEKTGKTTPIKKTP
jgi:hypothetical protein